MDGDERRKEIIKMLMNTSEPLSGRKLGEILKVSRQVIVQDVALIRAQGLDIIATARGYILYRDTPIYFLRAKMQKRKGESAEPSLLELCRVTQHFDDGT